MDGNKIFSEIAETLMNRDNEVGLGKMMSSPGIQYKGKNFAFLHNNEMTFKLGKQFNAEANGIHEVRYLNPFKTKPPLKAWYIITESQSYIWPELAEMALDYIKKEIG
jgi:hypothetical protein